MSQSQYSSVFAEHLKGTNTIYHSERTTAEEKRLRAVQCALDLIASYGSNEKIFLHEQMDVLSDYADKIQAALEVKK